MHPFTEINLQDEFVTPITLVLNYLLETFCQTSNKNLCDVSIRSFSLAAKL